MTKNIVFMMGCPGAGKSTICDKIYPEYTVLDCDKLKEEHPDYDSKKPEDLHAWSATELETQFQTSIDKGIENLVVDGTGGDTDKIFRRMTEAKTKGYNVGVTYVTAPLKTCLERNQTRDRKVPESIVVQKYNDIKFGYELIAPHADKLKVINNA